MTKLVGKPYDPVSYNCYHLAREVRPDLPDVDAVARSALGDAKEFRRAMKELGDRWEYVSDPKDFDIAIMDSLHIGIVFWEEGEIYILHNPRHVGCVVFEPLESVARQHMEVSFVRFN